jgi:hypothetical protein
MRLLTLLLLLSGFASAHSSLQLHGMESFSVAEQQKLRLWLEQSFDATNQLLGPYPFVSEVYLTSRSSSEPVPWAYTQRMEQQQVFFQVDARFELDQFQQDWTAAHEFSHLALPLLDREDLWFAEGFASYMQYQILQKQQQLAGSPAFWYQQKLQPLAPLLQASHLPLVTQLKQWLQQKRYKAAYWGSALFFIEAEQLLKQQGTSLSGLMQRYQQQNRLTDQQLTELVHSLDLLLDKAVFAPLLNKYQQQPGLQIWQQHPAYFASFSSITE